MCRSRSASSVAAHYPRARIADTRTRSGPARAERARCEQLDHLRSSARCTSRQIGAIESLPTLRPVRCTRLLQAPHTRCTSPSTTRRNRVRCAPSICVPLPTTHIVRLISPMSMSVGTLTAYTLARAYISTNLAPVGPGAAIPSRPSPSGTTALACDVQREPACLSRLDSVAMGGAGNRRRRR